MPRYRRRSSKFTYISPFVKYMIFFLNFFVWLLACLLFVGGVWALYEKIEGMGTLKVETVYDILLNLSLLLLIFGSILFIVSFCGFVGALRENECLLRFYSVCLLVFFLLEMMLAIVGFVFPHALQATLEESLTDKIIQGYRDDPDLENLIDFVQQQFQCCGFSSEGYADWGKNEYFNCSSPSVEKCGVPYSCCVNTSLASTGLVNIMCGYGVRQSSTVAEASKQVWTTGCIEVIRLWAERNLYTLGSVALGIALAQLVIINLSKTLESQIELQKARWSTR